LKSRRWTEEEVGRFLSLYEAGYPSREIAVMLSRTESSVRFKVLSLGYSSRRRDPEEAGAPKRPTPPPQPLRPTETPCDKTPFEIRAEREIELGEQRKEDREKVDEAKRAILEERILDEFRRSLCDMPKAFSFSPPPPLPADRQARVAVLVVSDSHVGQVVDPREIEGIGRYNPAVTLARVHHLEQEAARILRDRPVSKLLLLFGGDILHGHLGHSLEDDLTVPIAHQCDFAINIFFPFVCGLSRVVPEIEIHGVAGNHGRWPGMRKMPSDRRWSNLDTIFYGALAALCHHAGLANVRCDERISSRRTIDVGAFRLQLMHGDEVRGGNFCVGGMNREVTNSTIRHVQAGRQAPNYFIIGDKHFSASVPYGTGAFIVNGSFVGPDSFGLNFLPAPPAQTLFFLHPENGKTETHEIRLGGARLPSPLPYNLKPTLEALVRKYL
jgi:hypothetical protein